MSATRTRARFAKPVSEAAAFFAAAASLAAAALTAAAGTGVVAVGVVLVAGVVVAGVVLGVVVEVVVVPAVVVPRRRPRSRRRRRVSVVAVVAVVAAAVVAVVAGGAAHVELVIVLLLSDTRPVWASTRPWTVAAEFTVMLVSAMIVPTNDELLPSVAELPTCQNTLQACAPPESVIVFDVAVTRSEVAWKTHTELASPVSVRLPIKLAVVPWPKR